MAVRKTLQIGDPRLKGKNKRVVDFKTPKIRGVIQDCIDTMHDSELIGIAAPQIGENYSIFITEPRKTDTRTGDQVDELRIYINPKIIYFSKAKTIIYEGCGCVGNINYYLFGPVKRSKEIVVEAYDLNKQKFSLRCNGLLARVIQHEYDHLNGIEFIEKVDNYQKLVDFSHYVQNIKSSKSQLKASKITLKEVRRL